MTHSEMRCYFISQHKLAGEVKLRAQGAFHCVCRCGSAPDSGWLRLRLPSEAVPEF